MRFLIFSLALLFGIFSLAPNMQGAQFFKLNEMIAHYEQHQKSEESFGSFMSFIQEHYFANNHTNANERDMPFKSVVAAPLVLLNQEINLFIVTESFAMQAKQEHAFGDASGSLKASALAIWNPPKFM
jgi:hypothetical protein